MIEVGYALSSEEHAAADLVRHARQAEEAGFSFALISDHFHPWIDRQGQSPFVWSVLGAIAEATETLVVGTGVTCPTVRIHPAIIAQAAATTASLMPDRFFLGLGSGENLNEHILGTRWPEWEVRAETCTRLAPPLCRSHDVANLFVMDASFLPSSSAQNPALTVAAQALRVGEKAAFN